MKILVLGDCHTYFERVVPVLEEGYKIHQFDAIVQVGDLCYLPKFFGTKMDAVNQLLIDFVKKYNLKFYWIDGNHEDHSVLQYVSDFNNGVHNIYGENFIYQPRGSFIEINDYVLFFIGGAETRDIYRRTQGVDYFLEEIILKHQEEFIFSQIEKINSLNKKVIIIAHTSPQTAINDERNLFTIQDVGGTFQNKLLDEIVDRVKPVLYFHGHYHREVVYVLPQYKTKFFSIGGFLQAKHDKNDKKFYIVEL